jgi:hypothetical protein
MAAAGKMTRARKVCTAARMPNRSVAAAEGVAACVAAAAGMALRQCRSRARQNQS